MLPRCKLRYMTRVRDDHRSGAGQTRTGGHSHPYAWVRRAKSPRRTNTGNNLPAGFGRHERGQARPQEPFADQQQTDGHEQDGNRAFKPVIGDVRQQPRGKPCGRDAANSERDHSRRKSTDADKRAHKATHDERGRLCHEAEDLIDSSALARARANRRTRSAGPASARATGCTSTSSRF
jgi:hypothetical protein